MDTKEERDRKYWRTNLYYMVVLLSIWFTVSFVFSILLVDELDKITFFGFKLGFWFAQQGSIYVFVVLVFTYVVLMNRLDAKYEADSQTAGDSGKTEANQ